MCTILLAVSRGSRYVGVGLAAIVAACQLGSSGPEDPELYVEQIVSARSGQPIAHASLRISYRGFTQGQRVIASGVSDAIGCVTVEIPAGYDWVGLSVEIDAVGYVGHEVPSNSSGVCGPSQRWVSRLSPAATSVVLDPRTAVVRLDSSTVLGGTVAYFDQTTGPVAFWLPADLPHCGSVTIANGRYIYRAPTTMPAASACSSGARDVIVLRPLLGTMPGSRLDDSVTIQLIP
jgi:hypothetical protein